MNPQNPTVPVKNKTKQFVLSSFILYQTFIRDLSEAFRVSWEPWDVWRQTAASGSKLKIFNMFQHQRRFYDQNVKIQK